MILTIRLCYSQCVGQCWKHNLYLFSGVGTFHVPFPYFTYVNSYFIKSSYLKTHYIPSPTIHFRVERWNSTLIFHTTTLVQNFLSLKIMSLGYTNLKFKNLWWLSPIIHSLNYFYYNWSLITQISIHWPLILSFLSSLHSTATFQIFFCQHFQFLCSTIFIYPRCRSAMSFIL